MIEFRGKEGLGKPAVVSQVDLHPGLPGSRWLAGRGSRLACPLHPGDSARPDARLGVRREGEIRAAADRLVSLDQTFRIANTRF